MSTLVAIPVYNEQKYVAKVIERVAERAGDILAIDDGSTDYTPMLLAMQPVDVIRNRTNRGYGTALRMAFRWAQMYQYDWVITMDCDEQHEPESLPDFYQAIEADDADVINGSRYICPELCGDPPPAERRRINQTITTWVNDGLGYSITDAFCGFRAYRVSALDQLALDEDGYAIPLQQWVQFAAHRLRVKEVPIKLIYNDPDRRFGGVLDNAAERLAHYRAVFAKEIDKFPGLCNPTIAELIGRPCEAGV
ncbi:MAG: glycosyltransferase family 2 protein [Phycisphaeraceae bacterium]